MSSESSPDKGAAGEFRFASVMAFLILLAAYHVAFGKFFPTPSGAVGHDYSLALPSMLSGYYWFSTNGLWAVPWFTPAFCGGVPAFADPQSGYYSLLQVATFVVDPLASAYLTTLVFAGVGYWGCYILLRRSFAVAQLPAILGAAIFMFNGFSAHRALIGHLGYQGFMLVPWAAYALTMPARLDGRRTLGSVAAACVVGLIAAYWVQSGLGTLMIPVGLAIVLLLLLQALRQEPFPLGRVVFRAVVGGLFAGAVSAAKVVVAFSTMANFPRSDYLLPGYKSLADAFRIAFISLFFSPTDIAPLSNAVLRNAQWALDRHELEYGVTIVPLAIVLGGFVLGLSGVLARRTTLRVTPKQVGVLALIGVILFVPLALNTYTPEWNALLKRTPLLKSASTFVRWFCVYIPFLAVLSALIMQRWAPRIHAPLAVIGFAVVIVLNVVQDRSWYAGGAIYPPAPVLAAYRAVKAGNPPPPIRDIGVSVDRNGQVVLALNRNDALIEGVSQLYCYNPIFGYRLENLPVGDLHPGPVTDVEAGHYNIKNPACYVFPEENGCVPGDHFRLDQRAAMEDFVSYRQFPFKMSRTQAVANVVTQLGLLLSLVLLVATAGVYLAGRLSGREQAGGSR